MEIPCRSPCWERGWGETEGARHLRRLVGLVGPVSSSTLYPAEGWWATNSTITGPPYPECINYVTIQRVSPVISTWCSHSGTNRIAHQRWLQRSRDVSQDPAIFHHNHTEVSREQKYLPLYMKKCKWDWTYCPMQIGAWLSGRNGNLCIFVYQGYCL